MRALRLLISRAMAADEASCSSRTREQTTASFGRESYRASRSIDSMKIWGPRGSVTSPMKRTENYARPRRSLCGGPLHRFTRYENHRLHQEICIGKFAEAFE
jgi:hypothetical protein